MHTGTFNRIYKTIILFVAAVILLVSSSITLAQAVLPNSAALGGDTVYLPLVLKRFPIVPGTPVLNTIDNSDGDGSYTVSWQAASDATAYTLQEDTNADFSAPTAVYNGSGTSANITMKDVGTYYYRVKAENSYAGSSWSTIESAVVTVPLPTCPQYVAWRGITSQNKMIQFEVDNSPQCQITRKSLSINYLSGCGQNLTTVYDYVIPVNSGHFDTGAINQPRVIGSFTSPVSASGTFDYTSSSCPASGTWTAEPNLGANGTVYAIALQPDGKMIVGGSFTTLGGYRRTNIGRLNSDGSLDMGFNPVVDGSILAAVLQSDGKIVIGGGFEYVNGQRRYDIARLNTDGSLDPGFNPGQYNSYSSVRALAIQKDGKIIAGGSFDRMGGANRENIARLNADGSLDTTFNPGAGATVYAVAVQEVDQKILYGTRGYILVGQECPLVRLNEDGTVDSTFDVVVRGSANNTYVYKILPRADGKILVAGKFSRISGVSQESIGRLNEDGTVDAGFTRLSPGAYAFTIHTAARQSDNKILVGGPNILHTDTGDRMYGIARLNSDGSVDAGFNPDGHSTVYALAIQPDGKIILGGSFSELGGEARYKIARLNPDGTLDMTFP